MALMWRLEYNYLIFFFHLKFRLPRLVANLHLVSHLVQSMTSLVYNKMIFNIATKTTKSPTIKPSPPLQKQHFFSFFFFDTGSVYTICYPGTYYVV